MENWTENSLYRQTALHKQTELPTKLPTKLVDMPEQILIEAEARFSNLDVNLNIKNVDIQVPDIIYYEPYVLRFDRQK